MQTHDKIRILIVDDEPEGLWRRDEESRGLPSHPSIFSKFGDSLDRSKLFDLRWVATPEEAREFRDRSRLIAERAPNRLQKDAWVPEIVVIDYLLKGSVPTVKMQMGEEHDDLYQKLSPLPSLQSISKELHLDFGCKMQYFDRDIPDSLADYGCFAGGMILTLFADYPCVPVTLTANTQTTIRGRMTKFFEWLLAADTGGALAAQGRTGANWSSITNEAASRLRNRIAELAQNRTISLSLGELLQLKLKRDIGMLTIQSRYGVRRLPLEGLFCDFPKERVLDEASDWVVGKKSQPSQEPRTGLLEQLVGRDHFDELSAAVELSDKLWDAYTNTDHVRARLKLAALFRQFKQGQLPETGELATLWERFSTTPFAPNALPESLDKFVDIRFGDYSDLSRRWACLMVLVQLLQFRVAAIKQAEQSDDFNSENDWVIGVIGRPLHEDDLYLALFPIAKNPIDLKNKTDLEVRLKRLKPPLRIKDLLPERPGKVGSPQTSREASTVSSSDRQVMEWYALSQAFPEAEWDKHTRDVIRGT